MSVNSKASGLESQLREAEGQLKSMKKTVEALQTDIGVKDAKIGKCSHQQAFKILLFCK